MRRATLSAESGARYLTASTVWHSGTDTYEVWVVVDLARLDRVVARAIRMRPRVTRAAGNAVTVTARRKEPLS